MAPRRSSTSSATASALSPYFTETDSVNDPVGYPGAERYPGAIDPAYYAPDGNAKVTAGGPSGPVAGGYAEDPFTASLPTLAPGGGYQDAAWTTGHDGPQAAWDSAAGEPFAPSGALPPELHGYDTGGVYVKEHVVAAEIGRLTRRTMTGQTFNRVAPTQEAIGQTAPNGRADLDQQQWHDPDGYNPWAIPYSERPINNNLAYQNVATEDTGNAYGIAAQLSDRAPYDYAAQAYIPPADPAMQTPIPASDSGIGGGWV